jgi:ATP-dependent RNA helicase DeaD
MTRVFIGAGRQAGVRPQDLVGAIANEAHISGREIGAIEIADRFSLVEVAADVAQAVIGALRETTLKGRKVTVRRERSER